MVESINGCSFGKVTRNMIENIDCDFKEFRKEIRTEFKDLKDTNTLLYNHLSDRLPRWAVVLGALGTTIIGVLVGALARGMF